MHLAFVALDKIDNLSSISAFARKHAARHEFYRDLINRSFTKISHVQRAADDKAGPVDEIMYYFVADSYGKKLRWWQEPVSEFELLVEKKPDIILLSGLDLPLNYRWLHRLTTDKIIILGRHTGETIWPSRNLWLQQFGLRVVDAFLFHDEAAIRPWTKASVILSKQPVYTVPDFEREQKKSADQLRTICSELLRESR